MKTKRAYCSHCSEKVAATAERPNHILHLMLSVVTFGLWLWVWLVLIIWPNKFTCTQCGSKV